MELWRKVGEAATAVSRQTKIVGSAFPPPFLHSSTLYLFKATTIPNFRTVVFFLVEFLWLLALISKSVTTASPLYKLPIDMIGKIILFSSFTDTYIYYVSIGYVHPCLFHNFLVSWIQMKVFEVTFWQDKNALLRMHLKKMQLKYSAH